MLGSSRCPLLAGLAAAALTVVVAAPLPAEICALDDVPAATLLLPYFEVDLEAEDGSTTLLTINNAGAAPVLAHVTLWTDLSVATIDFDLYLTGYDVQSFNLRDVFAGRLPQTGPDDSLSPRGGFSDPHAVPASCEGGFPVENLPSQLVRLLRQAHTGVAVDAFGGLCAAWLVGDGVARGFVTVDVVEECSVDYPNTPGYFDTVAGFENVLWGDWVLVDPAAGTAFGENLVHIEADRDVFGPGDYTFYGRYHGYSGADAREPLGLAFGFRFVRRATAPSGLAAGSEILCWRDPGRDIGPVPCGTLPSPFPLGSELALAFDEEENVGRPGPPPRISPLPSAADPLPCPWSATRQQIGGRLVFPVYVDFGWVWLELQHSGGFPPVPPPPGDREQGWVTVLTRTADGYGVGFDALAIATVCNGPVPNPPNRE